jgi:hypothetical protein
MPEYTLSNSAAVIDAAISSVAGADNTPTASSQNMVTSGGVKNYVDTEASALDTRIDGVESNLSALGIVSISTASVTSDQSGGFFSNPTASFGTGTSVKGVDAATHRLTKESTTVMRTPTGGDSILSVNIILNDNDTTSNDNYIANLLVDGATVARERTPWNETYGSHCTLNYSGYVGKNKTIGISLQDLSGASASGITYSGSLTCVNYQ